MTLDEAIHQAQRLRIMATLFAYRQLTYGELRRSLDLSDGNLATHAARLVSAGYVTEGRVLAGTRFEKRFRITPEGAAAFRAYAVAMKQMLAGADARDPDN